MLPSVGGVIRGWLSFRTLADGKQRFRIEPWRTPDEGGGGEYLPGTVVLLPKSSIDSAGSFHPPVVPAA
ncbi:hypothetical protein [Arthrobacter methylotrophus]|uniref:hypothetical protein n=1 Tax=Arthrobacter methylotrophus TaxID=121291 RepID=UPI0031EB7223